MNQTGTFKMTEIQPITPYLCCKNAAEAVEFYVNAFGAEETDIRIETPDGQIGHVELAIGKGRIMLSDEFPEMGALSPETLGGSPIQIVIEVEDADAVFQQAVEHGAEVLQPVIDRFYGKRAGQLKDPFGHHWTISMPISPPKNSTAEPNKCSQKAPDIRQGPARNRQAWDAWLLSSRQQSQTIQQCFNFSFRGLQPPYSPNIFPDAGCAHGICTGNLSASTLPQPPSTSASDIKHTLRAGRYPFAQSCSITGHIFWRRSTRSWSPSMNTRSVRSV